MNRRIWLIIVCIFAISPSFGQSLPSYVPTNGLVGWWPFDGNANDISGNGYHGTAYGVTATDDRHGNNNAAFSFDITSTGWGSAKDRIVITDDAIANAWHQANAFTISTWIKLDTKTGSFANRPHTILGVWDGNGTPITRHQISASNYQSTRLNSTVGGTTPVANNDWVHVVTTWDGDTLRHYQNGIPAGHSYLSYSIPSSTNYGDITFGELHMGNGHWYHFVGSMDDMGVWDRALSNNEISQLYNAPVPCSNITIGHNPPDVCSNNDTTLLYVTLGNGNNQIANPLLGSLSTDLIAFYPFNGNADDTSGNGYNGTPSNLSNAADRLGNPNSAFEFNGTNSRIEVGMLPAIDCSSDGAFTVSGWFKSNQQNEGRILSFYPTTPDGTFSFQWSFNPSSSVLHVNVAKSQSANAPWAVITTTISNPSQWNHAVMTYEDGSLKLFINGSLAGSSQYTGPYAAKGANTVFNVDYISYDPNERFDGFIDDIGIWNNALSIDKIKALYTGQSILWSTGQNTDSIYVSPNSYQETFTVDVYSGNSVCSDSITVRAQNPFNFSDTTICLGDTLSITADLDYQSGCLMNISHTGIPPGDPIPGFTYGGFYQGHYYYVHNTPTTWTQGERLCRQNGGYLVCINDINENTFVSNLVPSFSNKNIWIGLYRDSTTCEFRWLNCINIAYTNWRPGEPNNDPCNEPYTQIIRGCSSGLNSWNNLDDNAANGSCYSNMVPILEIDPTIGSTASISVLWSTGDTTNTIDVSPTTTTSYWVRKTIDSDTIIDTITVHVLDPTINTTSSSYCTSNDSATLWVNINEISSYNTCSGLPSTLENGLVAWYPMNGNANDESGNGLNGTTFNTNTVNGRSASSTSLDFNGSNSYIEASTNPLLENITSALTLSAWIKPNNTGSEGAIIARRDFVGNPNGERTHFQLSITSTGAIQFAAQNNSISNSNILVTSASQTVDYQDWNHVASTFEQDTVKIYHNGQLIHSQHTPNQVLSPNNHWMNIGRIHRSGGNTFFNEFSGSMDEIGIWNRAITLTEVNYLYSGYSLLWSTNQTDDSLYIPLDSTFQYYVVASQNGTTCSDSITISVNQGIQASDTTICYGENVTLSTVSGQSAIWSTGDTTSSITVNPATTTKYWATTSYVGGTCSDTLTVFVNAPKINSNDLYSCAPQDSVLLYNSNHLYSACSPLQGSLALNSNGWYPFCGNSNDLSSSQNNAIVNGAVLTDDRLGGTNSAYYFDGVDDYLNIFNNASNNYGTSSISMAAWVKIPTVSNPQQAPIIGNYISTTTAAFNLMVGGANELNPGKLNFFARNSSGAEMNLWSTTRIDDDQWHHVAIVRNSTNDSAFLYIDGTINRKSAIASGSFDSFQGFVIGGAHLNRYLKCTIDEVATWHRALTSSEIHQLATQAPSISNWSTSQTNDSIWVNPTQTTTYWIEQSLNGVTCADSATVFINKVNIEPGLPTICTPGDSVLLYAPGVEQGFDEPNCNSGYVGLRPTYTPGESINGYSYKGMYNGHHYYLANSPGSWTDAAAAAKIAGGHLVCIDDVNEQNFIANLSTGNLWLGYYRTPTNEWAWVNCQTSTYTNWRSGEPGTSEPYAHIITDNCSYNGGANQWNDIGNLSNNGVCYSNCYGVLEIDPDEIGFGQNSQVLSWSNGARNDSIWLTPNQDGGYWLTSYVNGEGCSDTVSLRVLNPAITAPTTTSCSPGDSVMLYFSGNREFSGLDTIAVPDQLIGQVTKPMTALWTQSWNVTPNQTYIMKVSGLYDVCCGSQGCLDAAFLTLNCYSQSQQSASNPCSSGGWWIFNDDCGIRPDNDVYNPSHEYYYTFENTDGTIDLSFSDNVGDNSGSLTFTLYSTKQKVVRTYNDTITWSTGETSDTIWVTPTITSTYSVTASRGGVNCLDSVQIDVTTLSNFDPLIPTRIHCDATNTILDGTDASAISYNWSTGAQTSSTTVNTSGQYWVQAADNLGCSFSDTTQVWLSNIQSNLSSVEPTCYGLSNGSITPNPTGGISSYSYLWSHGDTTAALSGTASGLYWVTVTDSVGCSVQDSILLDEPADLTVTASATSNYNGYNIPCFGGSNGQASAVVSGGTLPYTYSWSNGSPDSIVYSLAAGTHTVNIMDSNGCITSDTVLITQPTGINTSLSSTSSYNGFDISCYGVQDGSIQLAVSGGVTPYQHYWSNGANGTSVSNIGAGLYTVNTVDANGCSSVDSITLIQPNVLTSTATVVSNYNGYNVSCYGASDGSVQISAIGGNAPYTYSWSNGTTSNQNNGIGAGSYSVTVTDTNGCTVQNSVVLNEPTELQISTSVTSNFNGYPISCTGANDGSALVNSNGGTAPYTILWSNGDTSLTTNNLSAGTYFVTVTDANGCSKSDSVVLTDPIGLSNLTLSASSYNGFNISCHGENDGTISMTGVNGGTAPLSYYWNTGDSTSSITGLPVGNYTLTVTDVNGCSISDSLTLNQPTVLTSNASVTSNFNGTNISCNGATDGSAQVSGAGGVGPYTFLWNTSDTSTTIANLSAGTYTVLVTDANGCSTTDTVSLTEPSLFSITAGVQSNYNGYNISCAGGANGQVAALAIGGTGPYNYNWSNGSSSPGQNNLAVGMYIINVSDANGCSAADTLTLIEPPALSSTASVTSNYNGYNVSCQGAQDGSATLNAQGGVTPYSINWSNGASGATVSNLGAGVHTVTIQDANGCSTNASVNLTEPGGVSVTATSSPTTCFGADDGSATLTVSGGIGNFDIQWSNGGTGLNQTGLTSNWYTYIISTSPNCFLTDSIWVDQPEPLVIQVDTVPPTCISAFDGEINVVAFGGTPGYQYFLNGTAFSGFQDKLGTDSLEIVAVDMNNCDTTLILAMPAQTQSCLFIPNWFTPNGNNQEDAWRIEGFEYENLRLKVFNVMGQLVYTTESSTYIPWDGNYNGSPLPEGDYYYLIESIVNDSKYSGYVTILR
jgi:gliding motility-associated-like protein